jgi:hypothetical protein
MVLNLLLQLLQLPLVLPLQPMLLLLKKSQLST